MELPIVESCEGCGACCLRVSIPPFEEFEAENKKVPPELMGPVLDRKANLRYLDSIPCVWFDALNRGCQHYEWRPEICRDFEIGGWMCLSHRRENGIDPPPSQGRFFDE